VTSQIEALRNERAFLAGALKSAESTLAATRGAAGGDALAGASDALLTPQARVAALEMAMAGSDAAAAAAAEAAKVDKLRAALGNADARAAELHAKKAALEAL
jgi:hypothetical protein